MPLFVNAPVFTLAGVHVAAARRLGHRCRRTTK